MTTIEHTNEQRTSEAFSRQSVVFDEIYGRDGIIAYKRKRVRDHMLKLLRPGASMLELNCGTGEDALFFASKGFDVHATDVSEGMLNALNKKLADSPGAERITAEICSFEKLDGLQNRGPYDHVYSNFGGLNCTRDLDQVLLSIDPLLKPGGIVTLVIISKFCLWETLLLFKGKFRTAFRRFFSSNGRKAHIEGVHFRCWYHSPSYISSVLHEYEVLGREGLCTIVPPSYIEGFAEKHSRLFGFLKKKEDRWKASWPWKNIGDYFIISLRKPVR
jgi:ubiquinone/menaquinone biosynthesis C-methylase UbiE